MIAVSLWQQHLAENIGEILFDEQALNKRVTELAEQISIDYQQMGAEELVVAGILRGSVIFLSDLVRKLDLRVDIDFMVCRSYSGTSSSGEVQIIKDLTHPIKGRHLLIVEDIVDTGRTLHHLRGLLGSREPASLKICTLLDKPSRRETPVKVDYIGFQIPDKFVIGYGLDYDDSYRHLPYVGVLKPEAYMK